MSVSGEICTEAREKVKPDVKHPMNYGRLVHSLGADGLGARERKQGLRIGVEGEPDSLVGVCLMIQITVDMKMFDEEYLGWDEYKHGGQLGISKAEDRKSAAAKICTQAAEDGLFLKDAAGSMTYLRIIPEKSAKILKNPK